MARGDPEAQARFEQEWRERSQLMAQRTEQRAQFHQALLQQLDQGGEGASYLKSRGISLETVRTWQLGIAGGRLTIPLNDDSGQAVSFCGRAMGNQEPKYRNSTGDLLFQRNGLVFGLDQAAAAIRKDGAALLVEGPLDVIQLHQAGFTNAVAYLGTSVSALQLQLLRRQGMKHLLTALDGDSAGQAATERLIEQLQPQLVTGGLSASVVQLPEGQDADGLLRAQGAATVEGLIASSRHWLEWRLDRLLAHLAADTASPSLQILQAMEQASQALVEQLPDGVLRRSAEQRLTVALQGINSHQESIAAAIPPTALVDQTLPTARQRLERRVVQLAIHTPKCLFMLTSLPLRDGACRAAFDWVQNMAMTVPPDQLPAALLRLVPQIGGATGAVIAQAVAPGAAIIRVLHSQPEAEFEALADALDLELIHAGATAIPTPADPQTSLAISQPLASGQVLSSSHDRTAGGVQAAEPLHLITTTAIGHAPSTAALNTTAAQRPRGIALEIHCRNSQHRRQV